MRYRKRGKKDDRVANCQKMMGQQRDKRRKKSAMTGQVLNNAIVVKDDLTDYEGTDLVVTFLNEKKGKITVQAENRFFVVWSQDGKRPEGGRVHGGDPRK